MEMEILFKKVFCGFLKKKRSLKNKHVLPLIVIYYDNKGSNVSLSLSEQKAPL